MPKKFLEAGDVILLQEGHTVIAYVPERYIFIGEENSNEMSRLPVDIEGKLSFLAGRYIVKKTCKKIVNDDLVLHHVFCAKPGKMNDRETEVEFYQGSSYGALALIEDIVPIGKARITYELPDEMQPVPTPAVVDAHAAINKISCKGKVIVIAQVFLVKSEDDEPDQPVRTYWFHHISGDVVREKLEPVDIGPYKF